MRPLRWICQKIRKPKPILGICGCGYCQYLRGDLDYTAEPDQRPLKFTGDAPVCTVSIKDGQISVTPALGVDMETRILR